MDTIDNIDLNNAEFQNVWKLIQYTRQSVFLTGKAGTGKSTFLKYICAHTKKKYVVLAPTGIAAVNVGGATMHSFFRIPFKPLLPDDPEFATKHLRKRMKYPKDLQKLLNELELIVIDEISMVRADIIDFMDKILRVYCNNMREPFGGKQMLLVGDIFQLEPVVTGDMRDVLRRFYPNSFFFAAYAFKEVNIIPIELRKIYRQKDDAFISMLDRVRISKSTKEDIARLNKLVSTASETNDNTGKMVMTLATRRDMVDCINDEQLSKLASPEVIYHGEINGDFPESALPTDMELVVKVGAQVVFIKNDPDHRWVNGTIGKVYFADAERLMVELENGDKHVVEPCIWSNIKYVFDEDKNTVKEIELGSFIQFPIKLAWALTVHKSQGLTFNNVVIDFGKGAFSSGQAYVALSRCRSFEGITLKSPLNERDIFVNPAIVEFSRTFNDNHLIDSALERAKADDNYHEAIDAIDAGDVSRAFDHFIEGMKARSELHNDVAMRYARRKLNTITQMQQQIESYREIISQNAATLHKLAKEYVMMGDDCLNDGMEITPVLANYDKALSLAPDYAEAWQAKGMALAGIGSDNEAIECFSQVIRLNGNDYDAALQLGNIYFSREELADALNWYLVALNANEKEPAIHLRLAKLYETIGEDNAADHHRKKADKLRAQ
ncbi:MAG: AAA family ATPase, partial [Muribaculaceae bacterium]|nr:AAA family ATPase [Muribaculaceae bacterium]